MSQSEYIVFLTTDAASTVLTFYYGTVDQGDTTVGWENSVTLPAPNNVGSFSKSLLPSPAL